MYIGMTYLKMCKAPEGLKALQVIKVSWNHYLQTPKDTKAV